MTTRGSGLTLVELMVSLAITGILMVAALGVVSSLARVRRQLEQPDGAALSARVSSALWADLIHAERYLNTQEGFALVTWSTLDSDTLTRRHLLATVRYEVRQLSGRYWLLRTQQGRATRQSFTELVCPDIRRIQLADAVPRTDAPPRRYHAWRQAPKAFLVRFRLSGESGESAELRIR